MKIEVYRRWAGSTPALMRDSTDGARKREREREKDSCYRALKLLNDTTFDQYVDFRSEIPVRDYITMC